MIRRTIAALLVLIATILAPFAVGAYWVERTLMDAQQFGETIAPLADDPQVKQVIQQEATTAIIDALDVEQRLPEVLPPALTQAIASGVNSAVSDGVSRYVNGPRFGTLWTKVSQRLQQGIVRLVEHSDEGAVTLQEGKLVLDTTEVLTTIQQQLVADGIPFVGSVDVSQYGKDIVLADTPNLQVAIDALSIFLPVARWVWVLVVALFVAGVLLWRPRSRGLLWTGIGLVVGGGVTWVALGLGQAWLSDAAPTPQLGTLAETVTETLVRFLANALLVMVALGLALAVAAWLAGATRSGRRVRDAIRGYAHRLGQPFADGAVGRATARVPLLIPTLRALVILGAFWWAIAADPLHPSTIAWILLTVGVLMFCIEILEGAGRNRDGMASGAVALTDPAGLGTPPLATVGVSDTAGGVTPAMPMQPSPAAPAPVPPHPTAPLDAPQGGTSAVPPPADPEPPVEGTDPHGPPRS
jgi:hypothetical protein